MSFPSRPCGVPASQPRSPSLIRALTARTRARITAGYAPAMTALTMAHCNDSAAHGTRQCHRGVPVSPGRASGHAYVLQTSDEVEGLPEGAILVVPSLSVGFVRLVAQAAGVVAEHGSPLSTGAILAREAGVPVVVLERATSRLQEDDLVGIDGTSGDVLVQPAG